jgi:hypothetical protein
MNNSDHLASAGGVSAVPYLHELSSLTGPFIRLSQRPENIWLHADWVGFIDSERGQKACMAIVDAIIQTRVALLLNDNRNQSGPWPKLDDWLATVWIPALSAAGLKRMAHIHSTSVFTQKVLSALPRMSFTALSLHTLTTKPRPLPGCRCNG